MAKTQKARNTETCKAETQDEVRTRKLVVVDSKDRERVKIETRRSRVGYQWHDVTFLTVLDGEGKEQMTIRAVDTGYISMCFEHDNYSTSITSEGVLVRDDKNSRYNETAHISNGRSYRTAEQPKPQKTNYGILEIDCTEGFTQ